jgi:glycosyltransferase involved in cell wall biosynthesis
MNSIAVSVVIPVYNCEDYLAECLDTVIAQTFSAIEILVVNDASCDGSQQIIDEFAKKDSRIISIEFSENKGVSAARNAALERARGDYVVFLDGDDYWQDSAMLGELHKLARRNKADIVAFGFDCMDPTGKIFSINVPRARFVDMRRGADWVVSHTTWAHMVSRRLIADNHLSFDPALVMGEDALFNYAMYCNASRLVYSDKVYYRYRVNPGGATRSGKDAHKMFCTVWWFEKAIGVIVNSPAYKIRPELLQLLMAERLTMLTQKLAVMALHYLSAAELPRYIDLWARCFERLDRDYFDRHIYPGGWPDMQLETLELVEERNILGFRRRYSESGLIEHFLQWCKVKLARAAARSG